ncbi:MAG: MFS transporter, partial [Ilumatobacteraceae bacterium]
RADRFPRDRLHLAGEDAVAVHPGARRGEAMGFQQSATAVARVVGPPVAGLLFDRLGVGSPMTAGAAITLVALVVLVAWRLHHTPAGDMTPTAA